MSVLGFVPGISGVLDVESTPFDDVVEKIDTLTKGNDRRKFVQNVCLYYCQTQTRYL